MSEMPVVLQSSLGVFLGTLPLLGAIVWAAFQQSQRISRLETKFDSLNHRMNAQFDSLGTKMDKLIAQGAEQNERIAVIETKIDGPRLVAH